MLRNEVDDTCGHRRCLLNENESLKVKMQGNDSRSEASHKEWEKGARTFELLANQASLGITKHDYY